jgi:lipopolysaccharide/colanic/teichoic acid biosynthesis glycosyltransferase
MYRNFIKPLADRLIALVAFVLLTPLFIIATIGLAIANGGKPFFFQVRPGLHGRLFRIVKFKTMNDKRGADGQLLSDAERLTTIGSIVRKTSLDEIPQLLNVIAGQMSLVGPRPLLPEYLPLYNSWQARRHDVKPGITGWAQVNGRNAISWQQKFELDVYYVDHLSFALDCRIIWLTIIKVFKREGINAEQSATIEKFKGNT